MQETSDRINRIYTIFAQEQHRVQGGQKQASHSTPLMALSEIEGLVSALADPHACRRCASASSFVGPWAKSGSHSGKNSWINRSFAQNTDMFPLSALTGLALRAFASEGFEQVLRNLLFYYMERSRVVRCGHGLVLSAESQAEPESKGAALGQWQHGPREAANSYDGLSGTCW